MIEFASRVPAEIDQASEVVIASEDAVKIASRLRKPDEVPLKIQIIARVGIVGLMGAGILGIGCVDKVQPGGDKDQTPTATRQLTPEETATLTHEALSTNQPPATATLALQPTGPDKAPVFEPKSVLNAEFVPEVVEGVQADIDVAYQTYSESGLKLSTGNDLLRTTVDYNWDQCQFGDPADAGSEALILADKVSGCAYVIFYFHDLYIQTGNEVYYKAAVSIYNFARNELPVLKQEDLKNNLSSSGIN